MTNALDPKITEWVRNLGGKQAKKDDPPTKNARLYELYGAPARRPLVERQLPKDGNGFTLFL